MSTCRLPSLVVWGRVPEGALKGCQRDSRQGEGLGNYMQTTALAIDPE